MSGLKLDTADDCPKRHLHAKCPDGYIAKAEWAEKKLETHTCHRCPGCQLWTVWKPKRKRAKKKA